MTAGSAMKKKAPAASSSPRPRGRPVKGSEAALTTEIVAAAQSLFFEKGYEGTSTEDVAALAQCSKRTLYTRFRTKADLFEAVIRSFAQGKRASSEEYILSGRTLAERLHKLAERMVEALLQPDVMALSLLVQREATRFPELIRISEEAGRRPSQEALRTMLTEAGLDDADFLADQFYYLIQAPVMRRALGGQAAATPEVHENARRSVDFFLRGCGLA